MIVASRYRLGRVIRESEKAIVYDATHRNGASVWLKIASSGAHAGAILAEGKIANTIGSSLVVRDDGTTEDGLPYLVLDPIDGVNLAELRASGAEPARVAAAEKAVGSLFHAIEEQGYGVGTALDEDTVLVLPNGKVGLLALDAIVPMSDEAVAEAEEARKAHAPARGQAPRLDTTAPLVKNTPDAGFGVTTPMAMSLEPENQDGSRIAYLAQITEPSVAVPLAPKSAPEAVASPLEKVRELPRVVRAVSVTEQKESGPRFVVPGILLAAAVIALGVGVGAKVFLASRASAATAMPPPQPAPTTIEIPNDDLPTTTNADAPPTAKNAKSDGPAEGDAGTIEIDDAPTAKGHATPAIDGWRFGALRTVGGQPGMRIVIDGKPAGVTPLDTRVSCGTRQIQLGTRIHPVVVPCKGERVLVIDPNGSWKSD